MTDVLRALRPVTPIPDSVVLSALDSWVKPTPLPTFQTISIVPEAQKIHLFLIGLFGLPRFLELVQNLKPFTTSDDLQFGPELCGNDLFDRYIQDATIAFRFRNVATEIVGSNRKSISFLSSLAGGHVSPDDIGGFVTFILTIIDNASCWPYMPLPQKVPPLLFDNPIRQVFGSRRLHTVEPFLHLYTAQRGRPLQMLVLDSCPLLDAPAALCVVAGGGEPITYSDLPAAVSLPLGVPRESFLETCERCVAWGRIAAPQKAAVIDAYHAAISIATYGLAGFVGSRPGSPAFVAVVKNVTTHQAAPFDAAGSRDAIIHGAIYARQ